MLVIVAFALLGALLDVPGWVIITFIALTTSAGLTTVVICLKADKKRRQAQLRASLRPHPALAALSEDSPRAVRFMAQQG